MVDTPFSWYDLGKVAGSAIPPALWSGLRGDPNAQTLPGQYIPGGIQAAIGGMGDIATNAYNIIGQKVLPQYAGTPPTETVEAPDFVQLAQEHALGAREQAFKDIPTAVEPRNFSERVARDMVEGAGQIPILPYGGSAVVGALPKVARYGVNFLAPGIQFPKTTAAVGTGIAAGQSLYARQGEDTGPKVTLPDDQAPAPITGNVTLPDGETTPSVGVRLPDEQAGSAAPDATGVQTPATTSLTGGDLATLAAAALLGLGAHGMITRPLIRSVSESMRAGKYAQFNQDVGIRTDPAVAAAAGSDPLNPPPPPTTPIPGSGLLTKAQTILQDRTAEARAAVDQYALTPEGAAETKAKLGHISDQQSAQTRSEELFDTGVDWMTNTQLPSVGGFARRYMALPEEVRKIANDVANASDELDNRNWLMRQAQTRGEAPDINDPSLRHSMWNEPTTALQDRVAQGRADPTISRILDDYKDTKTAYIRHVAEERGLISLDDMNNFLSTHPNHVSRLDPTGRMIKLFGDREISPQGGPMVNDQNFVRVLSQQIPEMMRSADINDRNRAFIETLLEGQRAKPNLPKLVTELVGPDGSRISDPQRQIVSVGYRTGRRSFEIHDKSIHHMLTKGDDYMGVALQGLAHMNQVFQAGITGTNAILGGRLFGVTNLGRAMLSAPIERPKGMAGGLIDKALQGATGGHVGLRAFDPTSIPGVFYEIGADTAARMTKGVANAIERGTAPGSRLLRAALGPEGVQNVVDAMNRAYLKSNYHNARAGGLGGAGARSRIDALGNPIPTRGFRYNKQDFLSPYNPGQTRTPEQYFNPSIAFGIRTKALFRDLNNILNDAQHSYINRLNRKMSNVQRADEVGQLTGAPGRHGSSQLIRGVGATVPFFNASLQGLARAGRAFREAPVGVSAGIVATLAQGLIVERLLSVAGGPNHQNFLDNELAPQAQAEGLFFQTDHANPTVYSRLPVPQQYEMFVPMLRSLLSNVFATRAADSDPEHRQNVLDWFKNWAGAYITKPTMDAMRYGAVQNFNPFIQLPTPLPQMIQGLTGMKYRGDIDTVLDRPLPLTGPHGSLMMSPAGNETFPNQDTTSKGFGDDQSTANLFLSAILGQAYATGQATFGAMAHGTDLWDALNKGADAFMGTVKDINPLWPTARRESAYGLYAQKQYSHTRAALKDIEGVIANEDNAGVTRKGGLGVPIQGESKLPTDPTMIKVMEIGDGLRKYLDSKVQPTIVDRQKQQDGLNALPLSAADKRAQFNALSREIRMIYERANDTIQTANQQASTLVGGRVNFAAKINWHGTVQQFVQQLPDAVEYRVTLPD